MQVQWSHSKMMPTNTNPRIVLKDSSNELYKHLTPETWMGGTTYKECTLTDVSNFRMITTEIIETLLFMDHQYKDKQKQVSPHYSLEDVCIRWSFREDIVHSVLDYSCCAFINVTEKNYYYATNLQDMSYRPLHKEYELFIIHHLPLNKEYYYTSFLLAVQRTCYLWLSRIVLGFEFRGSASMVVYWGSAKEGKDKYPLYSCRIVMEYDLSGLQYHSDGTMVSYYNIRLGLPSHFFKTEVDKSQFKDDQEFYDQLWDHRVRTIQRHIDAVKGSLHCDEDITDIL